MAIDEKTELLPCPLDNGRAVLSVRADDERNAYCEHATVACTTCGCSVTRSGDTSKGGYADNSRVKADAIAAWNRRSSPDLPSGMAVKPLLLADGELAAVFDRISSITDGSRKIGADDYYALHNAVAEGRAILARRSSSDLPSVGVGSGARRNAGEK